jgi:hypothetical protein
MRQVYKDSNGRSLLRLGDIEIDYNPAFRLYLTSRNPNPHFLPEVRRGPDAKLRLTGRTRRPKSACAAFSHAAATIPPGARQVCIRVSVINFTVTAEGLEEQLLGDCVRRERPDLEEQRDSLLQSIAADKRQLQAPPCPSHCRIAFPIMRMLHAAMQELRRGHARSALAGPMVMISSWPGLGESARACRSWKIACCGSCVRLEGRCLTTRCCWAR